VILQPLDRDIQPELTELQNKRYQTAASKQLTVFFYVMPLSAGTSLLSIQRRFGQKEMKT
jgi:hypothetical protein